MARRLRLLAILGLLGAAGCGDLDAWAVGTQHDYDGTGPNSWAAGRWSWKPDDWDGGDGEGGAAEEHGLLRAP